MILSLIKRYAWDIIPLSMIVGGAALVLYMVAHTVDAPRPPQVVANTAPVVAKVGTQEISPIKVITFKPEAKAKTRLPRAVQADPKQHVTAATQVEPSERPQLVTTVLDEDTGESTTYVVEEPRPWLGVRNRGEVVLAYGVKQEGTVARLHARQELLQIKALGAGVVGSIDSDGDYFVGIGASYRW
jgi:hypothetical protein